VFFVSPRIERTYALRRNPALGPCFVDLFSLLLEYNIPRFGTKTR
jgi:hypothetical protein